MAKQVRDLIDKIKPFFRQYLETTGTRIRSDGKFICPSPDKHDTDPSANFVPKSKETQAFCHACRRSFDVLTCANWVEHLPLKGPEFIYKTVYGLAKRFGIPFIPEEMSERDIEILRLTQIYDDAFQVLRNFWENRKHIEARNWPAHLCYQMGVATVTSWDDFLARLQRLRSYSKTELKDAGIKPSYFNPEVITFTLFDSYGSPVGFAARDMRYGQVEGVSKYINTRSTAIYDKSRLVYGLHKARYSQGPVTVVEGYADVMSAHTFGLLNTVAICSSKPTSGQIQSLEEAGKRDIVLGLDYDVRPMADGRPTGQAKTEDFLNEYIRGRRGVRVRVVDWQSVSPNGKLDLDTFLMTQASKGLVPEAVSRSWHQLPKIDSFDWQLKILDPKMPADQTVERMIPIIAAEPVHARQEMLVDKLSGHTGVRRAAIARDLDAALDLRSRKLRDDVRRVTHQLSRDLSLATPEEAVSLLQDAQDRVKTTVNSVDIGKYDIGSSLDMVQGVLERFKNTDTPIMGIKTGIKTIDEEMNGLCPGMWIFGGWPGVGKCVAVDTLVHTKRGRIRADEVKPGDTVMGWDGKSIVPSRVKKAWSNGIVPTVQITTNTGHKIRVSGNHPFLCPNDWMDADDLKVGDFVAINHEMPYETAEVFDDKKLQKIANLNVVWAKIVSIESCEPEETIDIEVEGTHSFVANGFVTHNSSSIAYVSWNSACINEDAITLVMTIDDTLEEWIAKYIALQTGFKIGHCVNPGKYLAHDPEKMAVYKQAHTNIVTLISSGRLDVRDAQSGTTSMVLMSWVEGVRKENPGKKIAVWLDNFHCLTDPGSDPRIVYTQASKRLQNLADTTNSFIGLTAEFRKVDDRRVPTKNLLKETGSLEYDAKGIVLIHNEMEVNPDTTEVWSDASRTPAIKKPILKWMVVKNKNLYGVFKGDIRFQFDSECSRIAEVKYQAPVLGAQSPPQKKKWE